MRVGLFVALLTAAALAQPVMHEPPAPPTAARPAVQQDNDNSPGEPRNFHEFPAVHASGSATPSAEGIDWLVEHLDHPLIILDLRQESHALRDGAAVTWQATHDWAEVGHTPEEALRHEKERIEALGPNVQSEEDAVRKAGAEYWRFTVTDHLRPRDEEVDRFVRQVRGLPEDTWLHMHCRAGIGRTTTFLVMLEILKTDDSLEEILSHHEKDLMAALPGSTQLYSQDRAEFIRWFYRYVRSGYAGSWSEWVKGVGAASPKS